MWRARRRRTVRSLPLNLYKALSRGPSNVNIPWLKHGMGDADYIYAFQQIVMPIAHEFNPDFVIGSSYRSWSERC